MDTSPQLKLGLEATCETFLEAVRPVDPSLNKDRVNQFHIWETKYQLLGNKIPTDVKHSTMESF
jgi:hypothetical protein